MCREIAEYLLECVKDANLTSSGQYNSHNEILPTSIHRQINTLEYTRLTVGVDSVEI